MMIVIKRGTMLSPKQIRLRELISVDRVLASRGFKVLKQGNGSDTILPKSLWTGEEADLVFEAFNDDESRNQLLNFLDRDIKPNLLKVCKLWDLHEFVIDRQRFSHTFEWYVGELLIRVFQAFSASYGVEIDALMRPTVDLPTGDFDVISVMGDTSLLYIECKTGNFDRDSILRMVDRGRVLHCSASIMLLRQQLNAKKLKSKLDFDHPISKRKKDLVSISIRGEPLSAIFKWGDVFFIDMIGLESKMRTALRLISASRVEIMRELALNDDLCRAVGYDVQLV